MTDINIGAITETLNEKLDLDAHNLDSTSKPYIAGLSCPSNNYDEITLGASGASYTAPANGYFCFNGKDSGNTGTTEVVIRNQTRYFGVAGATSVINTPAWTGYILPVKKGDVVSLYYKGTGLSLSGVNWAWRFYYAQGEV